MTCSEVQNLSELLLSERTGKMESVQCHLRRRFSDPCIKSQAVRCHVTIVFILTPAMQATPQPRQVQRDSSYT